jgi:hypothetical protein
VGDRWKIADLTAQRPHLPRVSLRSICAPNTPSSSLPPTHHTVACLVAPSLQACLTPSQLDTNASSPLLPVRLSLVVATAPRSPHPSQFTSPSSPLTFLALTPRPTWSLAIAYTQNPARNLILTDLAMEALHVSAAWVASHSSHVTLDLQGIPII